jgi:hypothetical protein
MERKRDDKIETYSHVGISQLILRLEKLVENKHKIAEFIKRPRVLISALKSVNDLIEMDTFKTSIVEMIQGTMVNVYTNSNKNGKFDNQMLHFCNYGSPGTGKTKSSKILAKIYYGIGMDTNLVIEKEPVSSKSDIDSDKLEELTEALSEMKQQYSLAYTEFNSLKGRLLKRRVSKIGDTIAPNRTEEANNRSWRSLGASLKNMDESLEDATRISIGIHEDLDVISTNIIEEVNVDDDPNVSEDTYCVVCGRGELVAGFIGQTAVQAYEFLLSNMGKTVIIEEAYSLYEGDRDTFGKEALVQVNRIMDEFPNDIIIGFNGYMKELNESIFLVQPGLKSRISKYFHMDGYTANGIALIFREQMALINLEIDPSLELVKFFQRNMESFSAYGRDTFRFAHCIKDYHYSTIFTDVFESMLSKKEYKVNNTINGKIIRISFVRYKSLMFKCE